MRFVFLIVLLVIGCKKSEPEKEPLQIDAPSGGPGWKDDKKLAASLDKLDKLKARDANRPMIAPAEARARPTEAPASDPAPVLPDEHRRKPAQPGAAIVTCTFGYAPMVGGKPTPTQGSYCGSNVSIDDAPQRCADYARERYQATVNCKCVVAPSGTTCPTP